MKSEVTNIALLVSSKITKYKSSIRHQFIFWLPSLCVFVFVSVVWFCGYLGACYFLHCFVLQTTLGSQPAALCYFFDILTCSDKGSFCLCLCSDHF